MLTLDAARALAPDAAALKAAQGLVGPRKWSALGQDATAVWGHCQGSGASPYMVMLDKSDWTAKCSCPSKKFPCKHSLALMLYGAQSPEQFPTASAPQLVTDWMSKRQARADKAADKAAALASGAPLAPADAKAAAKRVAQREDRMDQGIQDLRRWLLDLSTEGLVAHSLRDMDVWAERARRLNDAQLSGLARRLLDIGQVALSDDAHGTGVLRGLGRLHVLLEAHARRATLTPEEQWDIDAALGVPQREEEIPATHRLADVWTCHGVTVQEDERLQTRRAWLQGATTGRWALVLAFAPIGRALPMGPLQGQSYQVTLGFFPGALGQRAALCGVGWTLAPATPTTGATSSSTPMAPTTIQQGLRAAAQAWSTQPWAERLPMTVRGRLGVDGQNCAWVQDDTGAALPLVKTQSASHWWSNSQGYPCTWFGEWDGQDFLVLSAHHPVSGSLAPLVTPESVK